MCLKKTQQIPKEMIVKWIDCHTITRQFLHLKVHFKYWHSQIKMHDKIVISLGKRQF